MLFPALLNPKPLRAGAVVAALALAPGCANQQQQYDTVVAQIHELRDQVQALQHDRLAKEDELRDMRKTIAQFKARMREESLPPKKAATLEKELPVVRLTPPAPVAEAHEDDESADLSGNERGEVLEFTNADLDRLYNGGRTAKRPRPGYEPAPDDAELRSLGAALGRVDTGKGPAQGPGSAPNDPVALFQEAYNLYAVGKAADAVTKFRKFIADNPNHEYTDNAYFLIGEAYADMKDLRRAIGEYAGVAKAFPRDATASEALYKAGLAHLELREPGEARYFFNKTVADYPDSRAARLAQAKLKALEDAKE